MFCSLGCYSIQSFKLYSSALRFSNLKLANFFAVSGDCQHIHMSAAVGLVL